MGISCHGEGFSDGHAIPGHEDVELGPLLGCVPAINGEGDPPNRSRLAGLYVGDSSDESKLGGVEISRIVTAWFTGFEGSRR